MRSRQPLELRAATPAVIAAAFALLMIFAAPAGAQLTLSPDRIVIHCVNSHCTPGTTTLTNAGKSQVAIYSISFEGEGARDFSETNNCGSTLPAGASCSISISVAFGSGNSTGELTIDASAPNSPQKALIRVIGNSGS